MKKIGKIIIVEGIWGVGKTTLIKNAIKKLSAVFISEPNHLTAKLHLKTANSITKWYLKAHSNNLRKAAAIAYSGKNVFIERSPLASVAFSKVFLKKDKNEEMVWFENYLKKINNNVDIYLIYLKPRKIKITAAVLREIPYLKKYGKINLLKSLDDRLRLIIKKIEKKNLISIRRNPTSKFLVGLFK